MLFVVLACVGSGEDSGTPPTPPLQHLGLQDEVCEDGLDNDLDGKVDCADPDCWTLLSQCPEICDDGVDNNRDGFVDCRDWTCAESEACQEDCADGVDNDMDGDVDCADSDCLWVSSCAEICDDGVDNNGNGLTDCEEERCQLPAYCEGDYSSAGDMGMCTDGIDNDGNGLIDCEEAACVDVVGCIEDCTSSADDDDDGLLNCDDDDCWGDAACQAYTAQVLSGTYRYKKTYSTSRTRSARYLSYSDKSGAGRLLTYERHEDGFDGQVNTSTDGLKGVLWVSSPAGAKQTCAWTLNGRSDSSFGHGSRYSSLFRSYFTSEMNCSSTYMTNWVGSSPSHYSKSNAGNLVFSSACALPSSHRRIAIEKAPLNHKVQSSSYVNSTTPYTTGPSAFTGVCGYVGTRSSYSSVYRFINNRYTYNAFGASSTTWQW